MKQELFKKSLILGVATVAFGFLSACASLEDDETSTEKQSTKESVYQEVCTAENQGHCLITYEEPDLNLNQTYADYAMSTNSSYQAGSATVSLSRPAQIEGLSVKDKMEQRAFAQQQADLALKPIQGGEVVCSGTGCSEALFKTEIEKTIHTTVTENQDANVVRYIYVTESGQMVPVASSGEWVLASVDGEEQPVMLLTKQPEETVSMQVPSITTALEENKAGEPIVLEGNEAAETIVLEGNKADETIALEGKEARVVLLPKGEQVGSITLRSGEQLGAVQLTSQEVNNETASRTLSLKERVAFGEEVHDWDAPAGETLRHLLMRWGELSGWTVVWKLDRDYNLEAGVVFRGKFTEVAAAFIRSFARATPAPIGTFYKGNRVLVINTQENENAN